MTLTAKHIKDGDWFMVLRNHKWYRKDNPGDIYISASQIGSKREFLIPVDEPVERRKK